MGIKIKWIGTGSGFNVELGNTSFTVDAGSPRRLLVDCGFTVPPRLIGQRAIANITDILLTHHHADHVGGLETLAFYNYFTLGKRGDDRPALHVATEEFAHMLWEHALKAGMGFQQDDQGNPWMPTLETYFRIFVGADVRIPGFPTIKLFSTPHVANMESYGLRLDKQVYYSGDTSAFPPSDPAVIFQDCHQGTSSVGDIHVAYERLCSELPPEVKQKTHLVHLDEAYVNRNPAADGFAGFVMPGDEFSF